MPCSACVACHDLLRNIAAAFVTMAGRATANGFSHAKPHHNDADVPPVPHAAVGQEADALNPSLSVAPPLPHVPPPHIYPHSVMAVGRVPAVDDSVELVAQYQGDQYYHQAMWMGMPMPAPTPMPMGPAQAGPPPPPPPVQNPTLVGPAASSTEAKLDEADEAAGEDDADDADADKSPVNVDDDDDTDTDTDTDLPLCKLGEEKERKDRARAEREQGQRGKAKRVAGDDAGTTAGTTTARKGAEGEGPGHDQRAARDLLMSVRNLQKYIASYSIMNCMPLLIFALSVF